MRYYVRLPSGQKLLSTGTNPKTFRTLAEAQKAAKRTGGHPVGIMERAPGDDFDWDMAPGGLQASAFPEHRKPLKPKQPQQTGLFRLRPGMPGYNVVDDEGEFEERHRTPSEARAYLAQRYDELVRKDPTLSRKIPKDLYIRRNAKAAQRYSAKVGRGRSKGAVRPLNGTEFRDGAWQTYVTVWSRWPKGSKNGGGPWVVDRSNALGYLRDSGWTKAVHFDSRGREHAIFPHGVNPNGNTRMKLLPERCTGPTCRRRATTINPISVGFEGTGHKPMCEACAANSLRIDTEMENLRKQVNRRQHAVGAARRKMLRTRDRAARRRGVR